MTGLSDSALRAAESLFEEVQNKIEVIPTNERERQQIRDNLISRLVNADTGAADDED